MRVGANSPSLWPTMFSCTYTGTCFLPSYTAIVWPTIAGTIVDARDQVLTTRFSRVEFIRSIFTSRCSAMYGPFLWDRLMRYLLRRLMMNFCVRLLLRVFLPMVMTPQGVV